MSTIDSPNNKLDEIRRLTRLPIDYWFTKKNFDSELCKSAYTFLVKLYLTPKAINLDATNTQSDSSDGIITAWLADADPTTSLRE